MRNSLPSRLSTLSVSVVAALFAQVATAEDAPSMTAQTVTVTANSSARTTMQQDGVYTEDYTPAQQASHLSDFLEVVPGVSVGGSSTVNQRIRVRGLDDSNLKVTVDGARQEGTLFYHMGDVTIDPDLLKQTKVSVGNNSVTLGNDAIGGGVAFETVDAADLLKPGQKIGAKLHAGYASNNDEVLTSATVFSAPTENVDLLAYYGKRDADAGEDGSGRKIQTDDSEGENILLKAGVRLADDHHVKAGFSSTENEGKYPLRPDFPLADWNPVIPQKVKRETYTVDYNFNPVSDLINLNTNVYQTKTQINRDSDYQTSPGYEWEAEVETTGAKIENTSKIDSTVGNHTLIAGVEHYKKESNYSGLNRQTSEPVSGDDSAKNTSVYLEDQWRIDKLTLTPGVRYDRYESPKFVAGGKKYDNVVGALAASYDITPRTQVFASYTELFNGPDLSQAIFNSNGEGIYVNNNLKAEEGYNSEVGISTTLRNLTTENDALQLSAKYFKSNIENFLQFMRTGDRPGRHGLDCETGAIGGDCQGMINSDEDYEIKGVELAANYATRNFGMGLSYSRSRSEGKETGNTIPTVTGTNADSGDRYMVNLNYDPTEELGLGWRSTYVASLHTKSDIDDLKKPNYDVHDVFLTYKPAQFEGITTTLGVYNIFDETYFRHASRITPEQDNRTDFEPGRNVKASLTYQF